MRYQRRGDGSVCLNSFFFIGPYPSQWQTTLIRLLSFMFVVMGWPAIGQALPGLVLSKTAVTVTEGGTQTYTVTLATEPSADVTVPVAAEAVRLGTSELTIPAGEPSGEMTLTGVDKAGYGSHRTVTLRGRVTSPASSVRREVTLTVLDDDLPVVQGDAEPHVI